MSETLTANEAEELKKSIQVPELTQIMADHQLDPASFERFIDAKARFNGPGLAAISSYPPFVARIPDFDPFLGTDPEVARNLDDAGLQRDLNAALSGLSVAGYVVKARRSGQTVFTLTGGSARIKPDADATTWTSSIKMHVASVSKLVTAMAMTKLLFRMGIDTDTPVFDNLPAYFRPHPTTAGVTFRQLLTHRSGFRRLDQGGRNDGYTFGDFRSYFEKGVNPTDVGTFNYHNGNSIGLRIAIAIITGHINRNANFDLPGKSGSLFNENMWDAVSIEGYVEYLKRSLFTPAGITASLQPEDKDSLAYPSSLSAPGWAADATPSAGTAAWWFSVDDILAIMAAYWQGEAIMPRNVARQSLGHGFGVDANAAWQFSGKTQDCFMKSGFWADGMGRTQQSVVAFAPNDTEIAAFVNSPVPANTISGIVSSCLSANIA